MKTVLNRSYRDELKVSNVHKVGALEVDDVVRERGMRLTSSSDMKIWACTFSGSLH